MSMSSKFYTNSKQLIQDWLCKPKPHVYSKFTSELLACTMFHFIGSISPTPYANGAALMVLVYWTAKTSGAHLNPALSLTFTMLGHTNPIEMVVYWSAQIIGCIIGAAWIWALLPSSDDTYQQLNGCFVPNESLSHIQIFGWEAFLTFTFILPIFAVVWYTTHKKGYGNTGPIMIGLSLFASAMAGGSFTGAALNPARVIASPVIFNCKNEEHVWLYVCGEICGAALVPLFIIPWYGINPEAWYIPLLPMYLKKLVKTEIGPMKTGPFSTFSACNTIQRQQISQVNEKDREINNNENVLKVTQTQV